MPQVVKYAYKVRKGRRYLFLRIAAGRNQTAVVAHVEGAQADPPGSLVQQALKDGLLTPSGKTD